MVWLQKYSYAQKSILIVLFFTLVRVFVSHFIGLGNDESYYWTYAHQLQINYFDHPPIIAFWIKIFTANLWLDEYVFFLRLGSFIGCIMASYFMYKLVAHISTAKAACIAVFLYNCSFYASISAGLMVMPDAPQMVFFTASMYCITLILYNDKKWSYWLLFGLLAGLAIMSKVHAVFLWVAVFLYAVIHARHWLAKPSFYVAILITGIIISPILIWNIQNDFITFRFHGERVAVSDKAFVNWYGLLKEIVGQLVVNNAINVVLVFFFVFTIKFIKYKSGAFTIFSYLAFPLLFCIIYLALFKQALPHWSGPVYVSLLPIAAVGLSAKKNILAKKLLLGNFFYTLIIYAGLIYCVQYYPGTFSKKIAPNVGQYDISLDAYGWEEAGLKFKQIYSSHCDTTKKLKSPIITNTWWGAHEEYYFAKPLNIAVVGLGTVKDIHHYNWRNKQNALASDMDTSFCLVHSYDYYDAIKTNKGYYKQVDSINTITIFRGNKPAYYFYVYRLIGWKNVCSF